MNVISLRHTSLHMSLQMFQWPTNTVLYIWGALMPRWQLEKLAKGHKCKGSFWLPVADFLSPSQMFLSAPHLSQMQTAILPFTWLSPGTQSCHTVCIEGLCVWHCLNPHYRDQMLPRSAPSVAGGIFVCSMVGKIVIWAWVTELLEVEKAPQHDRWF